MTTTEAELAIGAAAPDLELRAGDGSSLRLSSLWSEQPVAIVFLGALEGSIAVETAILWRDADENIRAAGGEIVAICGAAPDQAAAFLERWRLPYSLLCDRGPGYAAFGVSGGRPGSFVVDREGAVRYIHRNATEMDSPPTWDLVDAVCELTGNKVARPEPTQLGEEAETAQMMEEGEYRAPTPGNRTTLNNFKCAKCGYHDYEVLDVSATSGMMSRMVNLQNRRFSAVSCRRCFYTEFYKTNSGALRNIFDLLVGA